ncbi:MAG: hypothetical protein WC867_00810 [Candidatus Pacearchaeota archaeon]|jgi:Zn ribbon nucleic-acid-binding protein
MESHIIKTAGANDELDIRCPKCSSNQISIKMSSQCYFEVSNCKKCGYKKDKDNIID